MEAASTATRLREATARSRACEPAKAVARPRGRLIEEVARVASHAGNLLDQIALRGGGQGGGAWEGGAGRGGGGWRWKVWSSLTRVGIALGGWRGNIAERVGCSTAGRGWRRVRYAVAAQGWSTAGECGRMVAGGRR
eukprot:7389127-Prymnesium_polylepis.3